MSKRDPLVLIEDIMLAIQKIGRYTSQMDHDGFIKDELVVDGVARNLEIIGEAARQLPEEYRRAHPELPWAQIAGLRNRNCSRLLRSRSRNHLGDHPGGSARP